MLEILVISDNLLRTKRLVHDLSQSWSCFIHDLYDDVAPTSTPEIIVSDVKDLSSTAYVRLCQILQYARGGGAPFLCLLHDCGARSQVQADLLGASGTLSASTATRLLMSTLKVLHEQADPAPLLAHRHADKARQFLSDVFVPGRPLTPDLVDVGTEIVAGAVREIGIRAWVRTVRRFDDATHQHCLLVAGLGSAFSTALGLGSTDRHSLARAALLHDVGKIHVPTAILNKPGKLDDAEMAVMRTHPTHGHTMLMNRGFEDTLLTVVRSHHEMLDGSGYPDKLKGWEIPDFVRLVTICDVYGALIERRPYRAPMLSRQAYATLEVMKGQLDTDFVRAFHPIAEAFSLPAPLTTVC